MRFQVSNKTGTASVRRRGKGGTSASYPRLLPRIVRVLPTYNVGLPRPSNLGRPVTGADRERQTGGRVVIALDEHRVARATQGQPGTGTSEASLQPYGHAGRHNGRALLIESDDEYAMLTSALLRREGWDVEHERSGRAAVQRLLANGFGMILVDTALARREDGGSLLAEIRSASAAPVIVLSAQEDHDDIVSQALEIADYDLVKPFSPRRFRAALRAVARRGRVGSGISSLSSEVRVGDVTMSFGRLEVVVGDRRVELSPREFALLHLMLAHPGTVFTREELARLAWGWRGNPDSRAVDNAVRRLRQKIESNPKRPAYIITERGAGYRFAAP